MIVGVLFMILFFLIGAFLIGLGFWLVQKRSFTISIFYFVMGVTFLNSSSQILRAVLDVII